MKLEEKHNLVFGDGKRFFLFFIFSDPGEFDFFFLFLVFTLGYIFTTFSTCAPTAKVYMHTYSRTSEAAHTFLHGRVCTYPNRCARSQLRIVRGHEKLSAFSDLLGILEVKKQTWGGRWGRNHNTSTAKTFLNFAPFPDRDLSPNDSANAFGVSLAVCWLCSEKEKMWKERRLLCRFVHYF